MLAKPYIIPQRFIKPAEEFTRQKVFDFDLVVDIYLGRDGGVRGGAKR